MLVYIFSFAMLLSPFVGLYLISSRLSLRLKILIFAAVAVTMIALPILAVWLFGGTLN